VNSSDKKQLIDALTCLGEAFGRKITDVTVRVYQMALEDLPIGDVMRACKRAALEMKFFPKPVELRELAGVLSPAARAAFAWEAFSKANDQHGYYASVDFDDPIINATIRNLGGWERVSTIEGREEFETWLRKDFERIYVRLLEAGITAEAAAPLIGHNEKQNRLNGHQPSNPIKVITGLPAPRTRITSRKQTTESISAKLGVTLKTIGST